jgi:uroporphyrinogen decarboxylase
MNGRERVLKLFNGEKIDRVPVMLFRHFFEQNDDNSVNDYVNWAKTTGLDILLVEVDGFNGCPFVNKTGSISDLEIIPNITSSHPFIKGQVDRVKRIAELMKDDAAVYPLIYTPFNNLKKTFKYEFDNQINLSEEWKNNKEIIENAMKFAQKCNDILLDEYKKIENISGVMISLRNGGEDSLSSDEYRSELASWDYELLGHANANFKNNIIHFCAWYGGNDLNLWKDYDYKAVSWDIHEEKVPGTNDTMSIKNARDFLKPETILIAGFDNREASLLYSDSKENIKEETKKFINEQGTSNFVVGADCSIDDNIPDKNIQWVIEACNDIGVK